MKRGIALVVLIGVGALLVALWRPLGDGRRGAVSPAPARPASQSANDRAGEPEPTLAPAPSETPRAATERLALESAAAPVVPSAAPATAAVAPEKVAHVHGRCIDDAARPLSEVEIGGEGVAAGQRSGAEGEFDVEVDLSGALRESRRLTLARAGLGPRRIQVLLRPGERHDLGDVVLLPAGSVRGRVIDAQGLALGGAEVRVEEALDLSSGSRFTGPENTIAKGEAGPDGRFLLADVPAGAVRVWAGQDEWLWSATERLELAPGSQLADLELVLAPLLPEDTIRLVVLDPAGAAVPKAKIAYRYELPNQSGTGTTQADENGRFRQFLDVRASYSFQARDPEDRYRPAVAHDVPPGTHDLVLQLGERRAFRLRVEDERGEPVERFSARVRLSRGRFDEHHEPKADAPRKGEVEIVTPPESFELAVEAEGFEVAKLGPYEPVDMPGQLVARLAVLPGVRGRVTSAGGPVAGARVSLHESIGADELLTVNGFRCFVETFPEAETTTDEKGEYVLTLRSSDDWIVRAEAAGFAPGDLAPLHIEAGVGARDVDLVLGKGGTIAGRVIVPAGEEPSGHIVGLSRGDGHGFTGRTDAAGEYRFEGLTPGRWQVVWRKDEISTNSTSSSRSGGDPGEFPWDCEVHEGRTTHFDLDLRVLRVATLSGRFLLGGSAPRDWRVTLSSRDDPALPSESASVDPNGRFRLTTAAAGRFDLRFHGELSGALASASTHVELVPGENEYEADVPAGALRGRLPPALFEPGSSLSLVSESHPGLAFTAGLRWDSDGRFTAAVLPAGPATLEYRTAAGKDGKKPVDIPRGGTTEVELP